MVALDIDIAELVKQRGAHSVRFRIPVKPLYSLHRLGIPMGFTLSDDPSVIMPCMIDEQRYRVADGYKIMLRPINDRGDPDMRFGYETFYQMDLESLMRRFPNDYRLELVGLGDDIH
jgi:hypothetical protein